jgi:tetratricopeptide (TPR) repeat protein
MRFTLPIAATLALTLAWQSTPADEPSVTDRCMQLMNGDEIAEEAATVCAAAAKESRAGMVLYGDLLSSQQNPKGAIEYYSKALEGADPTKDADTIVAALRARTVVYYYENQEALAFKDAVAYLEHEPEDGDILFVAAATAPSAESGLPFIERAIAVQPDDIWNYALHARMLVHVGKKKEALATADRALKIAPKDPKALTIKGHTLAAMGEHAKAERMYAQVVRATPQDPQPKLYRAESLIALGRYAEAVAVTTAALQDHPDHFEALQTRASAHLAMGDGDAALADIKRAKKAQPEWNASQAEAVAERVISIHQTLSPAGIARIEADRNVTLRGITRHLHTQCGNFRLPQFSPDMDVAELNSDLERYRNCFQQWLSLPEIEIHDSLTAAEVAAGERLYDAKNLMTDAEELRCSKMPKRSKCIQDAVFTKVEPLLEGAEDPFTLARNLEVKRFNSDLAALNKAIDRHNRNVSIADFLHGVAEALNE